VATATEPYQIRFDGLEVDGTIALNFSGRIELNPENPADRAVIEELTLGKDVAIQCHAWVAASGGKAPRDKEGAVKEIRKSIGLKVHEINAGTVVVIDGP